MCLILYSSSSFLLFNRLQTKLREGDIFTAVRLFTIVGVPQDHTSTPSRVDDRFSIHPTGMLSCFVVDFCFLLVFFWLGVTVSKSNHVWDTVNHSNTLTFVSRLNNIEIYNWDTNTGPFTWIHTWNIKWKTISVMNSCQAIDQPGLPELGHNSSICINHAVMLSCQWYSRLS